MYCPFAYVEKEMKAIELVPEICSKSENQSLYLEVLKGKHGASLPDLGQSLYQTTQDSAV